MAQKLDSLSKEKKKTESKGIKVFYEQKRAHLLTCDFCTRFVKFGF